MKAPLSRYRIHGQSMVPTLKPGQNVITANWFINLKKGDLVALQKNGRLMVKRVIKIQADKLFMVGDNQKRSTDSRQFGWLTKDKVIGKIIFIYS